MTFADSPQLRSRTIQQLRMAGCVFAEEEADLLLAEAKDEHELILMIKRRSTGEPIEHIVGWAEFCGLRVVVGPGVFVPRRRSEFLVEQAAAVARAGDVVLDMCCGSGALGLAVQAAVDSVHLYASDIEPAGVAYAQRNLAGIGHVFEGDLYDGLPSELRGRVNVMIVNAPYVPTGSIERMPAEARLHEPLVTLDGGSDGHDVQRRVVDGAREWLASGGYILMETSAKQAGETAAIMREHGLSPRIVRNSELDATVIIAQDMAP